MTDVRIVPTPPPGASGSTSWRARHRYAVDRLRGAQKGTTATPAYLRYVNRPLGGRLACLGFACRLTPSLLSAIGAALAFLGLAVLAVCVSSVATGVIVALLLACAYAFDSADGQLARIEGGGSPAGEWLDHVIDIAKTCALHSCVAVAIFRNFDVAPGWLLVPLVFLLTQVTGFFSAMMRDNLRLQAGLTRQPESRRGSLISSMLLLPFDHGTLCWAFVLLGAHGAFLAVYTAMAAISVPFTARALYRAHRNLVGLTVESSP